MAVKAVHGLRGQSDLNMEDDQRSRREGMVQFEALVMSLVSGHPNIVETFKCAGIFLNILLPKHG